MKTKPIKTSDLLKAAHAIDTNVAQAKLVPTKPGETAIAKPIAAAAKPVGATTVETAANAENEENADEQLYSVYKVVDGVEKERASKADITMEEAEQYVADRPDSEYVIKAVEAE